MKTLNRFPTKSPPDIIGSTITPKNIDRITHYATWASVILLLLIIKIIFAKENPVDKDIYLNNLGD